MGLAFADALGFARLFGLVTLFHVFAWAHYVAASAAVRAGNAAAAATLLPYIAALMIPFGLGQFPEFDDLRALVFSPAWYLFFTTLHVAETAPFLRGPRRPQLA